MKSFPYGATTRSAYNPTACTLTATDPNFDNIPICTNTFTSIYNNNASTSLEILNFSHTNTRTLQVQWFCNTGTRKLMFSTFAVSSNIDVSGIFCSGKIETAYIGTAGTDSVVSVTTATSTEIIPVLNSEFYSLSMGIIIIGFLFIDLIRRVYNKRLA